MKYVITLTNEDKKLLDAKVEASDADDAIRKLYLETRDNNKWNTIDVRVVGIACFNN